MVVAIALGAPAAQGQSIQVDFGGAGSGPSADYAAAAVSGTWNVVGVLPAAQRANLTNRDGSATGARIYMIGGTALLEQDDAATSGDDEALLDDMLIGFNDPVDVCVWFEGLQNGSYELLLYAMTPAEPSRLCRTRVDFATPGPTMVGGAWPGHHEEGITFSRFTVDVTDGTIGLHSGLWAAGIQSGLNGIQLLSSLETGASEAQAEAARLSVWPNPGRGDQFLRVASSRASGILEVFDVAGRRVRSLPLEGRSSVVWDGRDSAGHRVPAAAYFVRLRGGDVPATGRLVRID
jgi:hypothetical protein